MEVLQVEARPRQVRKNEARRLRKQGWVPAVVYGHGEPTRHIAVRPLALRPLMRGRAAYLVRLQLPDAPALLCVSKAIQFHPVTDEPMHVDFQVLHPDEKVSLEVPVRLVGSARGVLEGGKLVQPMHTLRIRVLPSQIPDHIDVDVSGLRIGQALHVRELDLPAYIEVEADPEAVVVTVQGKASEETESQSEQSLA
ncbi:MAG: 50S ribosomal protein L25 [Bacteroidetes bacterium]|nr:50S ribosomal protein L25 [Rhodothermia bacterium]MCS7155356.1 50S ribosomal protein L25 [Bacteroidota bacterium]MCX7907551.1 50S ribosomal protein L25 [Bacteroidota bacterium]MDW8138545.1 50S ribosomal protein L25 [Bacteroidota bacterium]MDW8284518.1 50S ribosomal protein L25 [Bacteroidota bacterium]